MPIIAEADFSKHFLNYFSEKIKLCELVDNCIQFVIWGGKIGGFTVGNFVLQQCVSGAIKCNLRP